MRFAILILTRNTAKVTESLRSKFVSNGFDYFDVLVIDAGSKEHEIPVDTYASCRTRDVIELGFRFNRGFNFGLKKMLNEQLLSRYDGVVLATNDTVIDSDFTPKNIDAIFKAHPMVGILSPLNPSWGEAKLLEKQKTRYFWYIQNHCFILKTDMIFDLLNPDQDYDSDFFFDGTNFRGYLSEAELIAKAYVNDWAAAITSAIHVTENTDLLNNNFSYIITDRSDINDRLYIEEGLAWLRRKYGYASRWTMNAYAKGMYDEFFFNFPELNEFKI